MLQSIFIMAVLACVEGAYSSASPLMCSTSGQPVMYKLPSVNPREMEKMENVTLTVSYQRPIHMRVSGWRIIFMDVICTTNYFVVSYSYTSSIQKEEDGLPIGDMRTLAKLEGMDVQIKSQEEKLRLRKLYKSIANLTLTSTAAASLYLNRTDILAQYVSGYLMVWPCVLVDRWWFRNSSGCSAYIPIKYLTLHGTLDGYLDTFHNRVYSWSPAGDCGPHYVVRNGSLITVYQMKNGLDYTVSSNFSSKPIGPIFKKIEMKASEWASSSSAMHESRPREFSYNDLTNPIGVNGRTWLEGEIERTYPMVSYLVHIKIATVIVTLIILIGTVWTVSRIRNLTCHVRRLEDAMSDVIGLKRLHNG